MKKTISYIFPIYNESGNIELLYKTLLKATKDRPQYGYEFIFVNDGSTDDSLAKLQVLRKMDVRVGIINFARNFGHQIAVTAGLDFSVGQAVIIMDSDMQDPPHVSIELIDTWEKGWDVVYAQRRTRKDGVFKRLTAFWFYWALDRLADIRIPRNTGDFRLIDRRVVDAIGEFREHNRFLRGLVSYVGFRQTSVQFDRNERYAGTTGYPFKKMLKFALDGILSFSWAPLKFITRIGYIISALSFSVALYALIRKIVDPSAVVPGWAFIVITICFIGGIQLLMLGVVGGYIGRIYTETQKRPLYILESVVTARNKKPKA